MLERQRAYARSLISEGGQPCADELVHDDFWISDDGDTGLTESQLESFISRPVAERLTRSLLVKGKHCCWKSSDLADLGAHCAGRG